MSRWGGPYVTIVDGTGQPVRWQRPASPPLPAGAATSPTPADVPHAAAGLPPAGRAVVRWRIPEASNPRSRTFNLPDAQAIALLSDIQRVVAAAGHGWEVDPRGLPIPARDHQVRPERPTPPSKTPPATTAPPTLTSPVELAAVAVPYADDRRAVAPDNALLAAVRSGVMPLGATVAQLADQIRDERWTSWSPAHRSNMSNALDFLKQVMVYADPRSSDTPDVAAWKRARLALPGVERGGSLHVALVLTPDLTDAIYHRRHSDRRIEKLNKQAEARWARQWEHYTDALAAHRAGRHRGPLPARPADEAPMRAPVQVSARTEQLFATAMGMVLNHAHDHGLLRGPNPWRTFGRVGTVATGYRRPPRVLVHTRNVVPMGTFVDLADAISQLGPWDARRGCHEGRRFAALVLAHASAARSEEVDGLRPGDYIPGHPPVFTFARTSRPVAAAANDGQSYQDLNQLKRRHPGDVRIVEIPHVVGDAITAHIEAGYCSDNRLFTAVRGGPIRWANLTEVYWRPAVARVCGRSTLPTLRHLERTWLRKSAITWLLRSGLTVTEVAEISGHDPATLLGHYAGVIAAARRGARTWTDVDDAWAWAVQEHDVP